jgi:cation diffusion facilitator family transporter
LLAALAYRFARHYAQDPRFTFGTGKLGDLAGFTSAIVLAMIALLIGWEAFSRLLEPVPIHFAEAIPIACLGLAVNIVSAWLLGGDHHHGPEHHAHDHHAHAATQRLRLGAADVTLEIFEDGVPPRFRLTGVTGEGPVTAETVRPDGSRQQFHFAVAGPCLECIEEIPEPHAFRVMLHQGPHSAATDFHEDDHHHGAALNRDNNMRAAVVHVIADAAVSVLVIVGLVLANLFGWVWMDPLAGLIGAVVIASWAYSLVRATGRILLDMNPDSHLTETLRRAIEDDGDRLTDLHIWRLGPGHLAAELSVTTGSDRQPADYRNRLSRFSGLSHVTIEVHRQ